MLKKDVTYEDIEFIKNEKSGLEEPQEVSKTHTLRFLYTLKTIKLYEQVTGRDFFDEYNKAFNRLTSYLFESGINFEKINAISEEEAIKLLPMLTDPLINRFLMDFIPCFYAEVNNGVLVQSEGTIETARDSLWLMSLVNVEFFLNIFNEISSKDFSKRKTTSKKSKKS